MLMDGEWIGLFVLSFFGFGTVVALATIIQPTQLLIDPDGMTLVQPWRRRRYDFKDCSEFRDVARLPHCDGGVRPSITSS
jgi:hypothetical protein